MEQSTSTNMDQPNGHMSVIFVPRSGYDLDVFDQGHFYGIHIAALLCIFISLSCAMTVIIVSFTQRKTNFFTWSKSDRFVVYIAVCDGLFNIAHSLDHSQVLITRSHVKPEGLCVFYGFMLSEFLTAQILMINLVAINAFCLIVFNKDIPFGKYDHRLLIWTFGTPLVVSIVAVSLNQLGPNTVFCFMDAIRGRLMNVVYVTIPLLIVFTVNLVLYGVIYCRLRLGSTKFESSRISSRSRRAARNMILFLLAFFVQYWSAVLVGVWELRTPYIPVIVFYFSITFPNIGGFLNGLVFVVIRRRFLQRDKNGETKKSMENLNKRVDTSSTTAIMHMGVDRSERRNYQISI